MVLISSIWLVSGLYYSPLQTVRSKWTKIRASSVEVDYGMVLLEAQEYAIRISNGNTDIPGVSTFLAEQVGTIYYSIFGTSPTQPNLT